MRYFSMFSGIGGFELGIQRAMSDAECVGYSEIDRHAEAVYRRHFPEHEGFGDATRIVSSELPNFDLLVAGFPCQSFLVKKGSCVGWEFIIGRILSSFMMATENLFARENTVMPLYIATHAIGIKIRRMN